MKKIFILLLLSIISLAIIDYDVVKVEKVIPSTEVRRWSTLYGGGIDYSFRDLELPNGDIFTTKLLHNDSIIQIVETKSLLFKWTNYYVISN